MSSSKSFEQNPILCSKFKNSQVRTIHSIDWPQFLLHEFLGLVFLEFIETCLKAAITETRIYRMYIISLLENNLKLRQSRHKENSALYTWIYPAWEIKSSVNRKSKLLLLLLNKFLIVVEMALFSKLSFPNKNLAQMWHFCCYMNNKNICKYIGETTL